jgi:hypothetical protein
MRLVVNSWERKRNLLVFTGSTYRGPLARAMIADCLRKSTLKNSFPVSCGGISLLNGMPDRIEAMIRKILQI